MKLASYIAMNTFFVLMLFFGYIKGVEQAQSIAVFLTWFYIIISSLMLVLPEKDKIEIALKPRSTPIWFDFLFDCCIVVFMLYHGLWIMGTFYFLHTLTFNSTMEFYKQKHKKEEEELAKEKAAKESIQFDFH